jgi:tRNA A-37 threonylcarbamoyl transferase component Bud32/TolB-like protein
MISDRFASIAAALHPRYRLDRLLQRGTAASVYLADDRALGQRVAVKVLHDEMAATVDADRFRSEIQLLAQLRHPHIVPVYDSGEADSLPYYVMPFIDGETLRARLSRLGRLPLAEMLAITEDVARALQFAHRHRIVHRDIKPENIILDRGRALVLDFGIALALDGVEASRRTLPGLAVGTVHYMSPEQLDTVAVVDGRSDVYSLACVVYEMMCGHPPFTGGLTSVMRAHMGAKPRSIITVCPGASTSLGRVVSRALEKKPDARYPTAGAFLAALRGAAPRVRVVGQRVAVAPFVHIGDEPRVDAFSDGIGEEIGSALRQFDGILVAAERPLESTEGDDTCVAHVGCAVDGDALLIGDVHDRGGDAGVLIAASLFDTRRGQRIWHGTAAGALTGELGGLSQPACDMASAVARALGIRRRPEFPDCCGDETTRLAPRQRFISGSNGRSAAR